MNKDVEIAYCPRDQFMPLHECKKRWMVVVAHRRSGKTVASLNQLIRGALLCANKNPRFAYIAPYRIQAKAVAWQYLKDFTAGIPDRKVSESELYIQLPKGGRITLYGADNSESLRGLYLDGVVVDEPADMDGDFFKTFYGLLCLTVLVGVCGLVRQKDAIASLRCSTMRCMTTTTSPCSYQPVSLSFFRSLN